eukprot:5073025-Lingulodinium_polyedra.AAC.1
MRACPGDGKGPLPPSAFRRGVARGAGGRARHSRGPSSRELSSRPELGVRRGGHACGARGLQEQDV